MYKNKIVSEGVIEQSNLTTFKKTTKFKKKRRGYPKNWIASFISRTKQSKKMKLFVVLQG